MAKMRFRGRGAARRVAVSDLSRLKAGKSISGRVKTGPRNAARKPEPMAKIPITFACGLYDRMLPLYTREVQADGIDLNFLAIDNPREIFDRMSGALEFDASEMSCSEFVARHAAGDCPFVALPVFPSRVFRHGHIAVNLRAVR